MKDYKVKRTCRVCGSRKLTKYLSLGNAPLSNSLLNASDEPIKHYPLEVFFCHKCALSQLGCVVSPTKLYHHYLYRSSISETFKSHCYEMALRLRRLFKFDRNIPAMMDIAANDGCLMKEFRKAGFIVFGVEPSKDLAGKPDFENTLVIVNDFWSHKLSKRWSDMGKHRDVITATNVLAHVDDIHDFLLGVKEMLLEKGVFVAEVPYLVNLIEGIQFDTIYHEHLSYFLLKPLLRVFKDCGLEIFKVERYPIHGGSIRIYAGHKGKHKVCKSVSKTLENEKRLGFHSLKRYLGFKENVEELRASITSQIISLHIYHKRIACYGASAKGINLLNYCGLSHRLISYVVDDTPEKVGKFIPSMRIPIVSFERFIHDRPDYIMLLAWNFKAELIEKTKHLQVKYIVPVPKVELL